MRAVLFIVALFLALGTASAATCDQGEKPFAAATDVSLRGDSIGEVCNLVLVAMTGGPGSVVAQPWGACQITLADGTPLDQQVSVIEMCRLDPDQDMFAKLGITPQAVVHVYGWGFASVFAAFLLGWIVGIAVGLVRKI